METRPTPPYPEVLVLSDDQIASMSSHERRALILRLRTPARDVLPGAAQVRRQRSLRLVLTVGGSVLLVPWTVYLAYSLPSRVRVDSWQTVWVGFDVLLLLMLAATAWLGWRRRLAAVLLSFGTGMLVLSDAWFDVFTATRRIDVDVAVATALLVELPVAFLLMGGAIRLLRLTVVRFLVLPASTSFWTLPLMLADDLEGGDDAEVVDLATR